MARMNSAAYVYFAMESGFNRSDYEKYSQGMSIMNEGCSDKWSNCFKKAKNCCARKKNTKRDCCASCKYFDATASCKRKAKCFNKWSNCRALVKKYGCGGSNKKECCATCSPSSLSSLVTAAQFAKQGEESMATSATYKPLFTM